ncbi:MAG: hypothetical protein P4M05_06910 [Bradyrhizobium sp.]|nr:hypothetical protein [Bradyrhizobium sp.]
MPIINGGRAELLDHPKIVSQLCSLERRTARGGKDSIDHPPGQHDDVVNAVAGALTNLIGHVQADVHTPPIIVYKNGSDSEAANKVAVNDIRPPRSWIKDGSEPWRPFAEGGIGLAGKNWGGI